MISSSVMGDAVRELPSLVELADERFAVDPSFAYRAAHLHPGPGIFRTPTGDGLIITAYRTLMDLMKHPALEAQHRQERRAGAGAEGALAKMDAHSPFFMNEPEHTPIAIAVYQPMSPARSRPLTELITAIAERAVDDMLDRNDVVDLRRDYAHVIARDSWVQFLGLPEEAGSLIAECSAAVVPMLKFESTTDEIAAANRAARTKRELLSAHFRKIRDTPAETFLHLFESSFADGRLPDVPRDAAATAAALTFDAVDTAANATANAIYTCLRHAEQWVLIRDNPRLVHDAWRESVRLEPSFIGLHRGAQEDIDYHGVHIPGGTNVLMAWGAANRDPRIFDDPDRFEIMRPKQRTLGFGGGSRICKGRHLATLEGEIALRVLLERLDSIELLVDEPAWGPPGMIRAIQSIPARLTGQ